MARYIVVEFNRNEDAEAFVKRLSDENEIQRSDRMPFVSRVVGIFVKPGKTCDCPDWNRINYGDKMKEHGVQRGEKFGWWVCTRCGKPRKAGHQLNNQITLSDIYEGTIYQGYETQVDGLDISGIAIANIDRPKKLRRKKEKK